MFLVTAFDYKGDRCIVNRSTFYTTGISATTFGGGGRGAAFTSNSGFAPGGAGAVLLYNTN